MKKRTVFTAAVLMSMAMLVGCGKDDKEKTATSGDAEATSTSTEASVPAVFITLSDDKLKSIGEYKEFTYEPYEAPDESDANEYIDGMVEQYIANGAKGKLPDEARMGTEVKEGDVLRIDYKGSVDGEYFEGGTGNTDLTIGSGKFIPGFEDALIGKKVGDSVKIDVTFPDPYQNNEDLSGKAAVFEVDIHSVIVEVDITRENAYKSYFNFETEEEFVADVLAYLKENMTEDNYVAECKYSYVGSVVDSSEFEDINEEIEQLAAQIIGSYEKGAEGYGIDFSTFILYQGFSSEDDFRAQMKEAAEDQLKTAIVFKAIAKQEGITLDQAKLDELCASLAKNAGYPDSETYKKGWDEQYGEGSCDESMAVRYYEDALFEKYAKAEKKAE